MHPPPSVIVQPDPAVTESDLVHLCSTGHHRRRRHQQAPPPVTSPPDPGVDLAALPPPPSLPTAAAPSPMRHSLCPAGDASSAQRREPPWPPPAAGNGAADLRPRVRPRRKPEERELRAPLPPSWRDAGFAGTSLERRRGKRRGCNGFLIDYISLETLLGVNSTRHAVTLCVIPEFFYSDI
uniref:Uncharacterized protein n=1 Tax=Oryza sativa subsp. japonica TaxID=39947 RepID=Q651Y1_ORYSJ|nr:hypothetical protein [Oryza sativa Japonica Group]